MKFVSIRQRPKVVVFEDFLAPLGLGTLYPVSGGVAGEAALSAALADENVVLHVRISVPVSPGLSRHSLRPSQPRQAFASDTGLSC